MARIELVNAETHRDVHIRSRADALLSSARHFVPVVASEFAKLAVRYPILFAKSAETGDFFAGAMLGIEAGENLFIGAAGEQDAYRPLELRRKPFYAVGDSLAIDMDHPRVSRAEGEPLFDADLQPTPYLRSIQAMITQITYGVAETSQFIDRLLSLKLVEPVDISLRFDDGSRHRLDGLYTVSSDSLHALDDREALTLFRDGHLRLAYLMISSLEQVRVLANLHNERLSRGA